MDGSSYRDRCYRCTTRQTLLDLSLNAEFYGGPLAALPGAAVRRWLNFDLRLRPPAACGGARGVGPGVGSVRPVWIRAGEPLPLYPELGIRSFSKLDQTDHIGRWGGAESECVGPKLGVHESDEMNEENHNLRFNGIFRRLCVSVSPGWIGSCRPMPVSRRRRRR